MARSKSGSKTIWWVLGIVLVVVVIFGVMHASAQESANPPQPTAGKQYGAADDESAQDDALSPDSVNGARLKQFFTDRANAVPADTTQLEATINSIIADNSDVIFGVSIRDLNNGMQYDYGNTGAMTAASVMKVLTATAYLHEVELGQKSLNTVMYNGLTAQENMEIMIVNSNNDAWHILNDDIGYANLQDYAASIGLTSYDYSDNTISSHDTARLLGDMYERKLINESNTQLLLSYMEIANYRDLTIPAIPATDTTYHKAGEYAGALNDAIIITNGSKTIVLSIYSQSTVSYSKSRVSKIMQQITTPTLEAFQLN